MQVALTMLSPEPSIEAELAAVLRGEARPWQAAWDRREAIDAVGDAAVYHGVAGLLYAQPAKLRSWPGPLVERLGDHARAQAMWELRHRQLLIELIAALDEAGVRALLMKGTAVAYDLYSEPAARSRGDTDLLVAARDAAAAKAVLAKLGYVGGVLGGVRAEFALQQPWTWTSPDGSRHSIDLHWQVMNAPSLKDLLPFAECYADARPLPRLSPEARTMDRVRLLIHTCLHRAMHCNTPYFVDGVPYFDSGRLIWSYDMHLLAEMFDEEQWRLLGALARDMGVSRPCLDGLRAARASLGTDVPADAMERLEAASGKDRKSSYFVRSRALARVMQDVWAFPGLSVKLRYARARILPDPRFIRAKYPRMARLPLTILYARRLAELVRIRASGLGRAQR